MATMERMDDEHLPSDIRHYLVVAMRQHQLGPMPEVHPVGTHFQPHSHIIVENWSVDMKNRMAAHIEEYHKPKPRSVEE